MSRYSRALSTYGEDITNALLADETYLNEEHNENPTEKIFRDFAEQTDPSFDSVSQHKYLDWICRVYLQSQETDEPIKAEDLYKIKSDLIDFETFNSVLPIAQRDINYYQSHASLFTTLRPHLLDRDTRRETEQQASEKIGLESSVLYDGEEGKVVIPHTKDAAIFWGRQTRWCVSATDSYNYFHSYNDKSPVYIYMPKVSDEERAMLPDLTSFKFCATGGTLYNELDNSMSYMPPSLKELFDAAARTLDTPESKREYYKAARFEELKPLIHEGQPLIETKEDLLRLMDEDVNYYRIASPELKADKDCAKKLLTHNKYLYNQIPHSLYEDREIARMVYKGYSLSQNLDGGDKIMSFLDNHGMKFLFGGTLTGTFTGAALGISNIGMDPEVIVYGLLGTLAGMAGMMACALIGLAGLVAYESIKDTTAGKFTSHRKIVEELRENIPQPDQNAPQAAPQL